MAIRAILFDFDYTLADSSDAIIDCFGAGLAALGLPAAHPDAIRATIGLPLEDSLVAVAGEDHRERALDFRRAWRQRSDVIMVDRTRLLPGAAEAVRRLVDEDWRLGVVSTKYRCRIEDVFDRTGLRSSFEVILGGDDVRIPKPDPAGLKIGLDRLGLTAAEAFYVGDSVVDGEAAQRAEMSFVAVLSGVTDVEALRSWKPLEILPSIAELPAYVCQLDRARPGLEAAAV